MKYRNHEISIYLEHGYYNTIVTDPDGKGVFASYDRSYPTAIEIAEWHIDILLGDSRPCWLYKRAYAAASASARKKPEVDWRQKARTMPYGDYLLTEHWQEVRRQALKRSEYRCALCNDAVPLHVHHRTYENLGDEKETDLIALCAKCHETFHEVVMP